MKHAVMLAAFALLASCGGKVAVDADLGAGGAGDPGGSSMCPAPNPQKCDSEQQCPCADGTTQIGGCPTGFTCDEACCGHGGPTG